MTDDSALAQWLTFATVMAGGLLQSWQVARARRWAKHDARELANVVATRVIVEAEKVAKEVRDENAKTARLVVDAADSVARTVAAERAKIIAAIDVNTAVSTEAIVQLSRRGVH